MILVYSLLYFWLFPGGLIILASTVYIYIYIPIYIYIYVTSHPDIFYLIVFDFADNQTYVINEVSIIQMINLLNLHIVQL